MNDKLIKIFSELSLYEESLKRPFPAKAYINAVNSLKKLDFEITTADDVKELSGFGKGLKEKVEQFILTGTFPKYEEYLKSDFASISEMAKIKGIGVNKAKELANAGICSIKELKSIVKNLNVGDMIPNSSVKFINSIKVGLEFEAHTDKTRMSVQEHDEIALPIIDDLNQRFNGDIRASFAGSRRRWNGIDVDYTIGDIDIILGVPENALKDFYQHLPSYLDEVVMVGEKKVSGIKNSRQVDFRIVKLNCFESLLLHTTGPMNWNIGLRKIAISKNMILNEYGLFNRETKELICNLEDEIMIKLLGKTVSPSERSSYKF